MTRNILFFFKKKRIIDNNKYICHLFVRWSPERSLFNEFVNSRCSLASSNGQKSPDSLKNDDSLFFCFVVLVPKYTFRSKSI